MPLRQSGCHCEGRSPAAIQQKKSRAPFGAHSIAGLLRSARNDNFGTIKKLLDLLFTSCYYHSMNNTKDHKMKKYKNSLTIMRAQPFHLGHESIVRKMLDESENVFLLIGSAQESGTDRNPFIYAMRRQMVENAFPAEPRLHIKPIADLGDYPRWADYVIANLGFQPDAYYCGDDQDRELFQTAGVRTIEIPRDIIPISASKFRETGDLSMINPANHSLITKEKNMKTYNFSRPYEIPLTSRIAATTGHFDIWEYPVVLPGGDAAIYETCVRQNAAMVVAEQDGQIVLTRQIQRKDEKPRHCLLGGMIENGEKPLHAAQRELAEESGLTSQNWKLIGEVRHANRVIWSDYFFMACDCKLTEKPRPDAGEQIELIRMSPEEFMTTILVSENFREKSLKDLLLKTPSPADIARFKQLTK
jgi:nicotinamide mononucleotide adenylyltransferase/ADP-ribose pyrophosphatase YjhB (NUDIX family)